MPADTPSRGSDEAPASDPPCDRRTRPVRAERESRRRFETRATALSKAAARATPVVSGFSRTVSPRQPEILLDPAETRALRALIAGVRDGRIDLAAAQRSTPPAADGARARSPISTSAPITIEPIAPSSGDRRSTPVTKPFKTLALVFAFALASTAWCRRRRRPGAAGRDEAATPINATPLKVQVVIAAVSGREEDQQPALHPDDERRRKQRTLRASLRMGTSDAGHDDRGAGSGDAEGRGAARPDAVPATSAPTSTASPRPRSTTAVI